jgi:hypothetical protein
MLLVEILDYRKKIRSIFVSAERPEPINPLNPYVEVYYSESLYISSIGSMEQVWSVESEKIERIFYLL